MLFIFHISYCIPCTVQDCIYGVVYVDSYNDHYGFRWSPTGRHVGMGRMCCSIDRFLIAWAHDSLTHMYEKSWGWCDAWLKKWFMLLYQSVPLHILWLKDICSVVSLGQIIFFLWQSNLMKIKLVATVYPSYRTGHLVTVDLFICLPLSNS